MLTEMFSKSSWGLNGVRPRRPEQFHTEPGRHILDGVSMESGLEGRNNPDVQRHPLLQVQDVSMESGLEGRNNEKTAIFAVISDSESQWSPA